MKDLNTLSLPELFAALASAGTVQPLLELALAEDLASVGDVTTESIIDAAQVGHGSLVTREAGVVCGLAPAMMLLSVADAGEVLRLEQHALDGDACERGACIASLHGSLGHMLILERTMLNLIGRLSGIATLTRQYVDAIAGSSAVICDTRKTTPGMRHLEKYATRCGGATLHRLGLYDAALYKDNHVAHLPPDALGDGLEQAIRMARQQHDLRFVEVEVDTLEQMQAITRLDESLIDIVLLDNFSVDDLKAAVEMRRAHRPGWQLEASGGVTLASVRAIAETGVDRISVGALTHSAVALDVALDIVR